MPAASDTLNCRVLLPLRRTSAQLSVVPLMKLRRSVQVTPLLSEP